VDVSAFWRANTFPTPQHEGSFRILADMVEWNALDSDLKLTVR
jgi:hypothetical protein